MFPPKLPQDAKMSELLLSSADCLNSEHALPYGPMPIPQARDAQILSLVKAWMVLDESARDRSARAISPRQSRVLQAFGERAASISVRERSQQSLLPGLLAVGISGLHGDLRDSILVLPLFYDAAQRIGVDPGNIFEAAAVLLPQGEEVASAVHRFPHRSAADRSLGAMGYSVGADGDGFRYVRNW
jgi:hypothetical protein